MKVYKLVNRENIEELLKLEQVYIVFSTERCATCQQLLESLKAFESDQMVYRVNNQQIMRKLGILNAPCLVEFKYGEEIKRTYGNKTQAYLKYFFEKEANEQ